MKRFSVMLNVLCIEDVLESWLNNAAWLKWGNTLQISWFFIRDAFFQMHA